MESKQRTLREQLSHPSRRALRRAAGILAAAAGLLAVSCGAPASRPAEGAIGEQIRAALESGLKGFDHSQWDSLLAGGVHDGLVDYSFFEQHRAELDQYLERIAQTELDSLAREHLMALLMNAYNALTISSILDHPEVSSIRQIDGVWTEVKHRVGGFEVTLDEIEHNLLRPYFRDPRIHFAVNCASLSCAPLPIWAFRGDRLEEQLDERTRLFLGNPDNVRIENGSLVVSRYFDWYGEDFVREDWQPRAESIPQFIARYASDEVAKLVTSRGAKLELAFMDYDWALNAAAPLGSAE